MFDDEGAEEIGIAAGAEDVPGKSSEAERRERGRMKEAEGVAPALGEERPEKNGAAGQDNCDRAFGEDSKAEEETKEDEGQPSGSREGRRVFVGCVTAATRGP